MTFQIKTYQTWFNKAIFRRGPCSCIGWFLKAVAPGNSMHVHELHDQSFPELKLTDKGLVDANRFELVRLWTD